jgi:hypothetical protein
MDVIREFGLDLDLDFPLGFTTNRIIIEAKFLTLQRYFTFDYVKAEEFLT